jgi:hypothetical protein
MLACLLVPATTTATAVQVRVSITTTARIRQPFDKISQLNSFLINALP